MHLLFMQKFVLKRCNILVFSSTATVETYNNNDDDEDDAL
jgi:hypothetical protein